MDSPHKKRTFQFRAEKFFHALYVLEEPDEYFAILQSKRAAKKSRIEAVLGAMLKAGKIRRVGQGRATRYLGKR